MRCLPALLLLVAIGCEQVRYDPERATRAYPYDLHTTDCVDVQVFREGGDLVIVNSTATSYSGFDVWVNQRYLRHIDQCGAGQTLVLPLKEFFDVLGDAFNAGGFWRTREPTPVRLVEVQPAPGEPLVGLVAIRAEPVE